MLARMKRPKQQDEYSEEEIARRRDETTKRMIAMPPKTLKGAPKRTAQKRAKPKR